MKNSDNQPKHTQGEWETYFNEKVNTHYIKDNEGFVIATLNDTSRLEGNEESEANAQRIVKAVNMHDEFINAMKEIQAYYKNRKQGIPLARVLDRIESVASQLLKQAEQK